MFADFYRESFLWRLVDGSRTSLVKTTNFCDIGFAARGRQLVVFTAIDNLVNEALRVRRCRTELDIWTG